MKRKLVVYMVLVLVAVGFVGILISIRSKGKVNQVVTEKVSEKDVNIKKYDNQNLIHFRNDILGIEFDYPKVWGEVRTSPSENITNLANINDGYSDGDDTNDNKFMVTLSFSKNYNVKLKLINDSYPGTFYPNGGAYAYGSMDNFKDLVKLRNICDYKLEFNKGIYHATETYNQCERGIKESVVLSGQYGSDFENYDLKRWAYKHLTNGYFDNLLLINQVAIAQSHDLNKKMTMEEIKLKNGIDDTKFQEDKNNLVLLVNSIKTFQPPKPTTIVFNNVSNEDLNVTTIRKYYYYLAVGELLKAFEMYENKNVSFDEYTKWYGKVFNTSVYDIKQIKPNKYIFDVDLYEDNQVPKKYRIVMEVNNNKINTLSSEEILSKEIKFGDLLSYTRLKSDRNEIVLINQGKEIVIDSADSDFIKSEGMARYFFNPRFSSSGNYLIYDVGVWEGQYSSIYDIKNKKFIKDPDSSTAYLYELSENEKYLVNCGDSDFDGTMRASVYSFPDLTVKYDFLEENNYDSGRECILKNGEKQNWRCDNFNCNLKGDIVEFSIESNSDVRPDDWRNVLVKYNLNEAKIVD